MGALLKYVLYAVIAVIALILLAFGVVLATVTNWDIAEKRKRSRAMRDLRSELGAKRAAAARTLAECLGWEGIPNIAELSGSDPDLLVRAAAVETLGKFGEDLLNSAAEASERRKHPSAVLTLDNDPDELLAAVRNEILPALKRAAGSQDNGVRRAAIVALNAIALVGSISAEVTAEVASCISSALRDAPRDVNSGAVLFSAVYPKYGAVGRHDGLCVYAHTLEKVLDVRRDIEQMRNQSGPTVSSTKTATALPRLLVGAVITVSPECPGVEFKPTSISSPWTGEWMRFAFALTPQQKNTSPDNTIQVLVHIGAIEIARISCPWQIFGSKLAEAEASYSSAMAYQKIFVSYSHFDRDVVETYSVAQEALGNDVFVDTCSIRSGENWKAALAKAINEADVLQLFWSEHSARSENVREEWMYALQYRCPRTRCVHFIRPVYWVEPMPVSPPAELRHIHFRFVSFPAYMNKVARS